MAAASTARADRAANRISGAQSEIAKAREREDARLRQLAVQEALDSAMLEVAEAEVVTPSAP